MEVQYTITIMICIPKENSNRTRDTIFIPFIIIDMVVASVLMAMGMIMLPPVMISMPFKLILFVMIDGWTLLTTGLVRSFSL
jgi:flagellar biosynthesis protein FliP